MSATFFIKKAKEKAAQESITEGANTAPSDTTIEQEQQEDKQLKPSKRAKGAN